MWVAEAPGAACKALIRGFDSRPGLTPRTTGPRLRGDVAPRQRNPRDHGLLLDVPDSDPVTAARARVA